MENQFSASSIVGNVYPLESTAIMNSSFNEDTDLWLQSSIRRSEEADPDFIPAAVADNASEACSLFFL